jgi:hypothetical protein
MSPKSRETLLGRLAESGSRLLVAVLDGIADGPTQTATAAIVPAPHLIPLASVRTPRAEGAGRVLGFALLLLLAAACLVWAPIRAIRSSGN